MNISSRECLAPGDDWPCHRFLEVTAGSEFVQGPSVERK